MIHSTIQTLVISTEPSPSVIVLRPIANLSELSPSRVVPIWIGRSEAIQLGIAIEKARFPRPMTHDLLLDALTNLDTYIDHVIINDVRGDMFFAQLILRQHNRLITLDARPSDALALATRQDVPLYIDEVVLEKASFPYIFEEQPNDKEQLSKFHTFLKKLSPEDFLE